MRKLVKPAKIGSEGVETKDYSYAPVGFELPDREPPLVLYLYNPIGDESEYIEMVHALRYAQPDREITIHINSPGGNLVTCLSILNAISSSPAFVTTIIDGEAASAAAFIWLAGHRKLIASPNVILMLHGALASYPMSKTCDIENSNKIVTRIIENLFDQLSVGILTAEERADIRKGIDVYLLGDDIMERVGVDEVVEEEWIEVDDSN